MARRVNTSQVFKCFVKDRKTTSLLLFVKIRNIEVKEDASLIINIFEENGLEQAEKRETVVLKPPFKSLIEITGLQAGQSHLLKLFLETGPETFFFSMIAQTLPKLGKEDDYIYDRIPALKKPQQGVSKSEYLLYLKTKASSLSSMFFKDGKQVKKEIMRGRKYGGISPFMNSDYKFAKPPFLKESRKKRIWLMSQAIDLYDDVFSKRKSCGQFLKNDWFMGPFYSYDQNFESGVRDKLKTDDELGEDHLPIFNGIEDLETISEAPTEESLM